MSETETLNDSSLMITSIAVITILGWLLASVSHNPKVKSGMFVVSYGRPMKGTAVFFTLVSIGILIAAILASPEDRMLAFGVAMMFSTLSTILLLEFIKGRVLFNDEFIECYSPWRSFRRIPWSAVTGYYFSSIAQWYVIETEGYGRIHLHVYLSGMQPLLDWLEEQYGAPKFRF